MAKKPVRLHFTETDLADEKVAKAAAKAEKAADKAEKANAKLPGKHKLRRESSSAANAKKKLRFGKTVFDDVETPKPKGRVGKIADHAPLDTVSGTAHREISRYEDDNIGVQAVHQTEEAAEGAAHVTEQAVYSHKLKKYENAEKLVRKSDNANVEALWQKHLAENPEAASNPLSRWMQKRQIKKEYAAARAAGTAANAAHTTAASGAAATGAGTAAKESKDILTVIGEFFKEHGRGLLIVLICAALLIVLLYSCFSIPMLLTGSFNGVLGTTYTAEDEDILAVDADYTAMETALRNRINNIESEFSGYDEYRYELDEIGHNPFELASYLTVLFEDYTEAEVQAELARLFAAQYTLTTTEEVEIRTRTETRTGTTTSTDPDTGETTEEEYEYEVEVEYEYYILNVTLVNNGLASVIAAGMDADQTSRYAVLMQTYGNKQYLFEDSIYAIYSVSSDYSTYEIPSEALSDEKFARMIAEAEKYLGYPYVWGGSSPSTSFDCSGFVCWVINNCGNGWSVGRTTAEGLRSYCTYVSPSNAQPGDLIFFQGTYDTSGASHVGIYVGNGMMIHCGNPIQYTSIETSYWQQHFLSYGRLP